MEIKALLEQKGKLAQAIRQLADKANAEERDFTAAEKEEWDKINREYKSVSAKIATLERLRQLDADQARTNAFDAEIPGVGLGGWPSNTHNQLAFRNTRTGEIIRALRPSDQLQTQPLQASVGDTIRAMLTGRYDDYPQAIRASMVGGSDTAGGFLLSPAHSRHVIDLARAASVTMRAGAQTIPMETGELQIARVSSDPTAQGRPETVTVPGSTIGLERITLRARTVAAIIPVSIELIEDAPNAAAVIEQTLQNSLAAELDRAFLTGDGNLEPLGIRNHDGVNTVASVGTPADYSDITTSVQNVLTANYPGDLRALAWIAHPRDAATYDGLADTTNQPLQPTPWAAALQKLFTTSLPSTEGGGSNESVGIVGDFSQVLIGMRTQGVRIRVLESGQVTDANNVTYNAADQLMKLVVAYLRVDVALLQPTWFSVMTGITNT